MVSRKKLTDEDYEDMARDYSEYPVAAEEVVGEIEYRDPVVLDRGRPAGDAGKGGKHAGDLYPVSHRDTGTCRGRRGKSCRNHTPCRGRVPERVVVVALCAPSA